MSKELFSSLVRAGGDLSGVFEYDGETGYFYFYLYRTKAAADRAKIIDTLHIVSGRINFSYNDVSIRWDSSDTKVALFIKNVMWAIFDSTTGEKFGGNYQANGSPNIPSNIIFIKSAH